MAVVALHNRIETVSRDHRVQVVGGRIPVLDLLPEIRSAVADDPGNVGGELADVGWDRDDRFFFEKTANSRVGFVNARLVFRRRSGDFDFRQFPVPVAFQRIKRPKPIEFSLS